MNSGNISVKHFTDGPYAGYCLRVSFMSGDSYYKADWWRPGDTIAVDPPQDVKEALRMWHHNTAYADMSPTEFVARMFNGSI